MLAGKHYAIKYIPRGATNKYVAREIINHSIMLHPHIVAFKEVRPSVNEVYAAAWWQLGQQQIEQSHANIFKGPQLQNLRDKQDHAP